MCIRDRRMHEPAMHPFLISNIFFISSPLSVTSVTLYMFVGKEMILAVFILSVTFGTVPEFQMISI